MSENSTTDAAESADDLTSRVERWLTAQMPIIQMHGGTSAVRKADPESGEVVIELGGACGGCSITPITSQNIEVELLKKFDEVDDVTVRIADDGTSQWKTDQAESVMGIDRSEGGRGGKLNTPGENEHF
ncbi:nitrogen-fixing NifU domain protein [Haladaptatus paucihalophilus DX253]|uniref:Fe-S cluster biogenesis protein NfuA, 4Fe-4S-binding domain n=1 Tax=Haladaptatus paucihalophilus DX253 TaxID=797209 RepID=E7QU65_HALPU|nr:MULTISPECIES: NifU family protein [Haladaptatus]EFW92144.1 nitrogen-fixing NifU domain protein [Haladaptatus paucihalophilus DX253]GKZ14299.1 NifU family protein [Haladaptatus sp. T7]SHK90004.1 Fe-S cluster biogenesis protein NfuA, 4Fe-4S-binding domain [Haladaptatus paucihalophilus DX253]